MIYQYKHVDWIKDIPTREYKNGEKIFLWGAGKIGSIVAHVLSKKGIAFEGFVDTARDKQGISYCGHKVVAPEELFENHRDAAVIISCAFPAVMDEIKKNGINDVHTPCNLLKEVDFSGFENVLSYEYMCRNIDQALRNYALYYGKGPEINHLMVMITDACTLNCEHCCAYVPYHQKVVVDSFETIISTYEAVMKVCQSVETVELFGGEPLTHPSLIKIVEYLLKDSRCDKIPIITNGTIPLSSELIKVLKSPKILLRISDYGELSSKKNEIVEACEREGIPYEITNYQYWDSVPLIQNDLNESKEELDAKYSACTANALYLKAGKVSHCCVLAGMTGLDKNLFPNFEANFVDVINNDMEYVEEELRKSIQHLRSRKHIDACKYCPGSHCIQWEEKVPVAGQVRGKLPLEKLYKSGERIH